MTEQRHSELNLHPIDTGSDEDHANLVKRQQVMRYTQRAGIVLLVVLSLGAGRTVFSRIANAQVLEKRTAEQTKIYLRATQAHMGGAERVLTLPATLQGYVQSPVAARAAGYIKRWTKDIGSRVEKGELLAEIAAPEIDQQLSQAIAARDQAAANLALAKSTADRWEGLRRKDVVSQQDLEEKRSAAAQSQANLAAAEANMLRLRQLEEFKRVVAPFAGVITRRNVDVGDLIDSSRVLFALSQTDPLRVYVSVPQAYAHLVKAGLKVSVTQSELADQRFTGKVARTAASIDAATRTMQVEVSLPNPDGLLLPGAYVQVGLPLSDNRALTAPTNTLLIRGEGTLVATVDDKGVVTLRRVTVGRNYGADFEVLDGISAKDRLILNPPDWLADGQVVTIVADKEQP